MARCKFCETEFRESMLHDGVCPSCLRDGANRPGFDRTFRASPDNAPSRQLSTTKILLTTETAPSLPIAERLEIITAECVLGMNVFKDVSSLVRDVVGGRSEAYQEELRKARKTVLAELKREAFDLGADAVVAVTLNYSEISGGGKSMLFLVAAGTAVRMEKPTSLD